VILGINFFNSEYYKYKYEDFSQNLTDFTRNFINGTLEAFFKSEEIPSQEYTNNILKLVGKTFLHKVTETSKEILLFVEGKNCGICENVYLLFKVVVGKISMIF
jgi:hypothetical protein